MATTMTTVRQSRYPSWTISKGPGLGGRTDWAALHRSGIYLVDGFTYKDIVHAKLLLLVQNPDCPPSYVEPARPFVGLMGVVIAEAERRLSGIEARTS